ncbi:hypothetical protein LT493_43560 [Streptomyces tricolor]|nr:hypothetical protein [Streptomyces tricolor]
MVGRGARRRPGWVVLGALKQIGGAFLAFCIAGSVGLGKADEPIQQYVHGFGTFAAPVALGLATSSSSCPR